MTSSTKASIDEIAIAFRCNLLSTDTSLMRLMFSRTLDGISPNRTARTSITSSRAISTFPLCLPSSIPSCFAKLLERWQMGYAETLRPELLLGTFTPTVKSKFTAFCASLIQKAQENNFLIGGELGAAIATSYLIPTRAVLYVKENYQLIAEQMMRLAVSRR